MTFFLNYQDAGVNVEAADKTVDSITSLAAPTYSKSVLSGIGGFGALFRMQDALHGLKDPVLVSGTDGVGTKVLLAAQAKKLEGIGQDLVAMCVNDILVYGAKPLFFLDYFAQGRLEEQVLLAVVRSIAKACSDIDCALIGGETAEMPGLYQPGHFDLAGFCVGLVDRPHLIDGKNVRPGDAIVGLASSGLHSNGFSLARAVIDRLSINLSDTLYRYNEQPVSAIQELLTPTRLYVKTILTLLANQFPIKAMAHITGGGIIGNLPRTIPPGLRARLDKNAWKIPPIFSFLQNKGPISEGDLYSTFNMGIGFTLVTGTSHALSLINALENLGETAYLIGHIEEGTTDEPTCLFA